MEDNMQQQIRQWFVVVIAAALIGPVLAACGGQPAAQPQGGELQGTITASGAFALYPMMVKWGEEYQKLHPGVQFDISAGGAGKGMTDALGGQVDMGMVSREIKPEEEKQGAYWVSVVKDAVFPAVNERNPVLNELLSQGVSRQQFIDIFITGKIKTWGELVGRPEIADEIHVYTRSDAAGAPETWAKYLGNKKQEDLLGIGVFGDPGIAEAVAKDPLGIGYNNLGYAYDAASGKPVTGLVVLPVDANDSGQAETDEVLDTKAKAMQAVASGKYPSPPARALNLVTKGKPSGLVQDFIVWAMTDGQKFVDSAGYIPLTPELLSEGLQKVK
jgi:phosphate transport system substrate-binding protein